MMRLLLHRLSPKAQGFVKTAAHRWPMVWRFVKTAVIRWLSQSPAAAGAAMCLSGQVIFVRNVGKSERGFKW